MVAPGSAAPKLGDMLASGLDPIVRLGGLVVVGLGGLVGWQLYRRWRSNSSGSSSKDSTVNVVISDADGGNNAD